MSSLVEMSPAVSAALRAGRPVVALESTIISHGLPRPGNLDAAREFEAILAGQGVTAATIALVDGVPKIGLAPDELERIAVDESVVKVSSRDIAIAMARKVTGGTTVAATSVLAARAGIRVFATGGLGGVHRGASETFDESADLTVLSRTPITVVSAGVKSILDIPATLERLETLGVAVVGYRTSRFPAFWLSDSGCDLDWRADTPEEIADIMAAREAFGEQSALLVANPLPPGRQLDPEVLSGALEAALVAAADAGIRGKAVSPFLLDWIQQVTGGVSVGVNLDIARGNIDLAAKISKSWSERSVVRVAPSTTSTHRVVVCGDVINDVLVKPLDGLGPWPGSDTPATIGARPGGAAANQAAWMAHLGADVVFAGRVGARDAAYHRRELARAGVRAHLVADREAETGSIVIMVAPDGERTMFTDRGANLRLRRSDVPAGLLDGAAALHLTGYTFCEPPLLEVALWLLEQARARELAVTIDPGSAAFLARLEPKAFLRWTEGAAVCFPNRDEAAVLTGEPDPVSMATSLTRHYGVVVVKLGGAGCVLATPGEAPVLIAAQPAQATDTTGAGDAFCGAFLSKWLSAGPKTPAAGLAAGPRTWWCGGVRGTDRRHSRDPLRRPSRVANRPGRREPAQRSPLRR